MKTLAVRLVLVLGFMGCASASYVSPRPTDPNDATVYLIRRSAQPYLWNLFVFLDQKKVASVSNRSFVVFTFPAGDHALHAEWPRLGGVVKADGTMTLKPGGTQYFVITGELGNIGRHGRRGPSTLDISEVSQGDGEALLKAVR
jgi:hypothetical protein